MSLDPAILRAMAAAGASTEVIIAAVEAAKAAEDAVIAVRREKAAAKKRRQRYAGEVVSPDVPGTQGDMPGQTGTNGDAPHPPLSPPDPQTPPLTPQTTPKERASRATSFPERFAPNDADLAVARQLGDSPETVSAEVVAFRDHHTAKGSVFKDWHAAFRTWLRSPYRTRAGTSQTPSNSRRSGGQNVVQPSRSVHDAARALQDWVHRQSSDEEPPGNLLAFGGR